ncbi:MAG: hypothetical protein JO362_11925 [Streptomycetaceae bacterium]|nr:hypothetical protein [Streptomycetaceae bacterium]
MGVESDHLVYDYLSRVGDLAQTALSADRRMRLVTELRKNIDRERSRSGSGDNAATVRRILAKLGTPDEVVKAVVGRPLPRHAGEARNAAKAAGEPEPAIPLPRDETKSPGSFGSFGSSESSGAFGSSGGSGEKPEWWRVPGQRSSAARTNEVLAGWTGGLLPPELDDDEDEDRDGDGDERGESEKEQGPEPEGTAPGGWLPALRVRRRRLLAGSDAVVVRRRRLRVGPLELLAALALIAGVVVGSSWALAVGWLIAYTTRGLTRTEAKWAALGMPGLVTAGALVWLWGRTSGRWGQPMSGAQLGPMIVADFPVVVKMSAIASALFLLWRSARRFH